MTAALAIGTAGCLAEDLSWDDPLPVPSPWFHEITVRTAGGYNDNVTLSAVDPEGSSFLSTGIEGIISRIALSGPQPDLFFVFDDIRYFSADSVEKEQLGLVSARVKQPLAGGWQAVLALEYVYSDQVLDVSTTETNLTALQVQGHGIWVRPQLRLDLTPNVWAEAEFSLQRQLFLTALDDNWEIGPKFTLGINYGHKSDVTLSYDSRVRNYDEDLALTADGLPQPGTHRIFRQHESRLNWRHYFDEPRRWRSTARAGIKINDDNGAGYFDFHKPFALLQLTYRARTWEIRAEARYAHYYYQVQRIGDATSPKRRRTETVYTLRAEKQLKEFLKVFAEYEYEHTTGNDRFEEYDVNVVTAGLNWIF